MPLLFRYNTIAEPSECDVISSLGRTSPVKRDSKKMRKLARAAFGQKVLDGTYAGNR
jgi:hypothetical protein